MSAAGEVGAPKSVQSDRVSSRTQRCNTDGLPERNATLSPKPCDVGAKIKGAPISSNPETSAG